VKATVTKVLLFTCHALLTYKDENGQWREKLIVCAIMRKLVHVIFGVLKSGKKYDPNFQPISA
jgi:hypothetical protein